MNPVALAGKTVHAEIDMFADLWKGLRGLTDVPQGSTALTATRGS